MQTRDRNDVLDLDRRARKPALRDRVFISYRTADASNRAQHLFTALTKELGEERVFIDKARIEPGTPFPQQLRDELDRAAVIVAVIGNCWLKGADPWSPSPLQSEDNWVRVELEYGLSHPDVKVIPFFVNGMKPPSPEQAKSTLPESLWSLAERQGATEEATGAIPPSLLEGIRRALKLPEPQAHPPPRFQAAASRAAPRDRLMVVLDCDSPGAQASPDLDRAREEDGDQRSSKEQLLAALESGLSWRVSRHTPDSYHPDRAPFAASELLTCQSAIVIVDRESPRSHFMASKAAVLAWRSALGMPLLTIPLHRVRRRDLRTSRLAFLTEYPMLPGVPTEDGDEEAARAKLVRLVSEHFTEALAARSLSMYSDPATKWADDVTLLLSSISDSSLATLGKDLHIPPEVLEMAPDPRRVLAATLFEADLEVAYRFLRRAVGEMQDQGAPRGKRRGLVSRVVPIWVDLNAGRQILSAAHLPPVRRLCGLRLSQLEWAELAIKRASANAPEYPSVRLSSIAGEEAVAELTERHDATLRACLHFPKDAPPWSIAERLKDAHNSVFAILDAKNLSHRQLKPLLRRLRERFPGITFVLVSDRRHDMWEFRPPIQIAIDHLEEDRRHRVGWFVRASKGLVEKRRVSNVG